MVEVVGAVLSAQVHEWQHVVAAVRERGVITKHDVQKLRAAMFRDGAVSRAEADALLAIDRSVRSQAPAFSALYVEALADYMVDSVPPAGYITADNADWLIAALAPHGSLTSDNQMELLVKVLDRARWAPRHLVVFALDQIKQCVVAGAGVTRHGGIGVKGVVTEAEAELVRRLLFAFGGAGHIAVSREEAELLFAIDGATDAPKNHPAWSDVFVKAIANHLLAASGYAVPSREEALKREAWLDERLGVAGFLERMVSGGFAAVVARYRAADDEARQLEQIEAEKIALLTDEAITAAEADWLAARIHQDGVVRTNERALLGFLRANAVAIHPSLEPLLAEAA